MMSIKKYMQQSYKIASVGEPKKEGVEEDIVPNKKYVKISKPLLMSVLRCSSM